MKAYIILSSLDAAHACWIPTLESIEFPQSQVRASEVIPTQVLQGTRKKRVR
jgi:hypothetical protein